MTKKDNTLVIKCDEKISEDIFNMFCEKTITEFNKIYSWFTRNEDALLKLTLVSKAQLDDIVKVKSEQYKDNNVPDWLVGFSNFEEVWVVIPNEETMNELYKVALHELIHLLSYQLDTTNKRLKILDEGIAVYLSKQYEGNILTPWVNLYFKNKLPKVSDFCTYNGLEFAQKNRLSTFAHDNRIPYRYIWKRDFAKMVRERKGVYEPNHRNR